MKTILVSGASGIVGYGVLKSLRAANPGLFTLIGTSIYADSIAPAFCDIFELAPMTSEEHYIDWLCEIIIKHKVDMIVPGIDADMQAWNTSRSKIAETGVVALLNTADLITLCSDKWLFYESLESNGSALVIESRLEGDFNQLKESFGMPFLLKPRRGFASKGIVIVDSEECFNEHKVDLGSVVMAQPIVGSNDEEYSVSAFFDVDSQLRCLMSIRRKLAKEGYTEKAVVEILAGVEAAILELAEYFKPVGPTNFQFRVHAGQLKILEINPRVSSATSIRTGFGYNESMMSVDYFLNNVLPSQPKISSGYAIRYVEDHIFYDSSTV
ncbi:MAG: ATP-grasp domain-containing protein [Cytophaga sp.]|nr:ATP-grasp domain-containing protein [Undibacterium sp.]